MNIVIIIAFIYNGAVLDGRLCDGVRWQPRSPWQEKGYVLVFRLQIFEIQNTGIHVITLYLS